MRIDASLMKARWLAASLSYRQGCPNADRARTRCSCFRPRLSVLGEQAVEFGPGCRVGNAVELAVVRNKLGGAHEAAPGGARQPTAEADAPYPERSDLGDRQPERPADHPVDRLRRNRLTDRGTLLARLAAGRVDAIAARR